jgi:ubiquinone/menaquinone biosynthesis C-methylase UbiE
MTISDIVSGTRLPEQCAPNIWSTLPSEDRGDGYDRVARTYDIVVGNSLYNRLVWGAWARTYADAARQAVADMGPGLMLDCGCGSLVFTADPYRAAPTDRMILFDRSMGMMQRGAARLPSGQFVQGDAFAMPFRDATFSAVVAWGFLHVVGSASPLLAELRRVAAPGATVTISSLVLTDRPVGNRMLGLLHRNGEATEPETQAAVVAAFSQMFRLQSERLHGSMLVLRGTVE